MADQTTIPMFPTPAVKSEGPAQVSGAGSPTPEAGDTAGYPVVETKATEETQSSPPGQRPQLPESWLTLLEDEFSKPYMASLKAFLVAERQQHRVFPPGQQMFNAFWLTPFDKVRVVILGQDPYHGPNQAHGLCFSVQKGVVPPPSLQNIFKELKSELALPLPSHGDLSSWAEQGVLLLNTVLSVRAHQANSHRGQGWETLTDKVIEQLNAGHEGLVFVLWGAAAGRKAQMIDGRKHLILRSPHPSPLSAHRGFMGCGHFAAINQHLEARGQNGINWALPS